MRVYTEYKNEEQFGNIDVGTCFTFNDRILIKTEELISDKRHCNAVSLETGKCHYFGEEDTIAVLDAVVKILA